MKSSLTKKQQVFVNEYLVDFNSTQAAIRAGYSKRTAEWQGPKLVGKTHVAEEIQKAMDKRVEKLEITAESVLQEIARLAFHDPRKFFDDDGRIKPISELDDDTARCIVGIETFHKIIGEEKDGMAVVTKIKLADKGANLERLGRYLKLFTDKIEITDTRGLADKMRERREKRNGKS